ncbi:phage portal protein [Parvimonas micra]|uniref:phage portal protein n=1 Tax=Parvimonas micra TaxID=33033 RepID=UPI00241CA9B5|nr:phage portal protein [Parvimonas micra]
MIKRSEDIIFNEDKSINEKALISCLKEHTESIDRFTTLKDLYDGKHAILKRSKVQTDLANNKLLINHAEYITDFATAYFMGNPIKYTFPEEETRTDDDSLLQAFRKANITQVDTELARDLSIFGIGIEYVYQDKEGNTKSTNLDPRTAFLIVDDTVEENTLIGVHRIKKRDENNREIGEVLKVITDEIVYIYDYKNENITLIDTETNIFNQVSMIEYWNKVNQKGDFESVVSLINAYNLLQSDRVNDKEQYVDSLLVLYGTLAGDNSEEKLKTARELKRLGLLELSEGDKVEYLSKTFHEADVELLKKSIIEDIHKISKVPNLTDENFAGNSSGVAMKYKLLGLEQLAQTKEEYYRIGLKERIKLYSNILNIKMISIDVDNIEMTFIRSLPVNELEIAQLITYLNNVVSQKTLLSLLPFVEDVDNEIERVEEQKQNNLKIAQQSFGGYEIGQEDEE